jgi:hypothetical protein
MTKKLLIIKAASDVCSSEIDHLKAIAGMFGISHCTMTLTDMSTFNQQLCNGDKYDFIYLGAHANTLYFGESDGSIAIPWEDLAIAFCSSDCLNYGAILLLGCCRGGLKRVALQLFCGCDNIDYVCGPRWTVTGADISAGFHVFIYNMVVRREQPSIAVHRASLGTGYDFFCHDRVEMEDEVDAFCNQGF